ncbi:N-acetyltransferase [Streptomyces inusitatus]|uniref:N-acetyltransferase n=1 Tax=Streptomyces inusitatus TaxID=68221 RepID=A0A918UK01_9ACTN|nr:GNAT family protein [Streptomyces inusitatus]GGZ15465.1 N-acetyltransferase [Streptomyces inusitatus]
MSELGSVTWPPAPIKTERLVLRERLARDREAYIGLLASPEVHAYLGGARPREEVEREVPEIPESRSGRFVVELDGELIGHILLTKETGYLPQAEGKAELGYLFLPEAWGRGYAAEACGAVLDWFAGELPGEPVVLATQTANGPSMRLAAKLGFTEVERFEAYGAEQWFGMWNPGTPSG